MNSSVDLRQLRYFVALCEELHFGRAAARLNISQPPLSRQIRLLEDSLGVMLFDRDNRNVKLTPAAETFLTRVRRVLEDVDDAISSVREPAEERQRFSVGYTTVFDFGNYPEKVFQRLQARFPRCFLRSDGRHSISLIRDVINGNLDVAFIGLHTDVKGLAMKVLHEEEMIVALPSTHALAGKKLISFGELAGSQMFWFKRVLNPGFYDYCQAYFDAIGFQPIVIPEPSDHHVLLGMIAAGRGYALIPNSMRAIQRRGVVFRKLRYSERSLRVGVGMVYREDRASALLLAFMDEAIANPPFGA